MKIPKHLALILLYMLFVFCVMSAMMQYAKHHPITDEPAEPKHILRK